MRERLGGIGPVLSEAWLLLVAVLRGVEGVWRGEAVLLRVLRRVLRRVRLKRLLRVRTGIIRIGGARWVGLVAPSFPAKLSSHPARVHLPARPRRLPEISAVLWGVASVVGELCPLGCRRIARIRVSW